MKRDQVEQHIRHRCPYSKLASTSKIRFCWIVYCEIRTNGACAQTLIRVPGASDFFFLPSFITTASTTRDSKIITTRSCSLIDVSAREPKRPPAGSDNQQNAACSWPRRLVVSVIGKGTHANPQAVWLHSMRRLVTSVRLQLGQVPAGSLSLPSPDPGKIC